MSKYKITILTPLHISSGEEYEKHYNLLDKNGFVYLYDEFKIVEYFISQNIQIPYNLDSFKGMVEKYKDAIISENIHTRKVESNFTLLDKPVLEQISTNRHPIVTGSSIKGSIRTAILDCLNQNNSNCKNINKLLHSNKDFNERLNQNNRTPYDKDLAEIFKYLKVSDSYSSLETKIYKTVNVKVKREHQGLRKEKVEEIANYVEAMKPNQSFEIYIDDISEKKIFQKIKEICKNFYLPFLKRDFEYYFSKKSNVIENVNKNLDNFIINLGRFGGAESKSLHNLRDIKSSKAEDKSTTTARTFGLGEIAKNKIYYENELFPFGWVMLEPLCQNVHFVSIPDTLLSFRKRLIASIEGKGIKRKFFKNKLHQVLDTDEETINTFIETMNMKVNADSSVEPTNVLILLDKVIENEYGLIFADRITKECDCTIDELVSFAEDENIDIVNEESIVSIEIFDDIKKYI